MTQIDALKRELSRNNTTSRNTTENEGNTGLNDTSRNNTTSRNITTRKCAAPGCNNEFIAKQWNHQYCSNECRAHGNGFESVEHVKKAVKESRRRKPT